MNPRIFHFVSATALTIATFVTSWSQPSISATAAAPVIERAPMTVRQHVVSAALVAGYDRRQIRCLKQLIYLESRWSPTAKNPRSSASGLFQHLRSPSGVMLKDLSVPKQTERGLRYIATRYGTACNALAFHKKEGHY